MANKQKMWVTVADPNKGTPNALTPTVEVVLHDAEGSMFTPLASSATLADVINAYNKLIGQPTSEV